MPEPKPFTCPQHPAAMIRHEWNRTQHMEGGGWPMGEPLDTGHQYFCHECGLELASEKVEAGDGNREA